MTSMRVQAENRPDLLAAFVRNMPVAVAIFDRDMRYLQASDKWCIEYALDSANLTGRTPYELLPSIPDRWKDVARRGLQGETLAADEDCFEVNGQPMWIKWEVRPWGDQGGLPEGILIYTENITKRKNAENLARKREAQLHAALEAMTDAFFISDTEGNFIEFNEAFATFHKFPSKQQCAKALSDYPAILDVFRPDGSLTPLDQWAVPRALRGETAVSQESTLQRRDTGERWVGSYNFAPIRDEHNEIVGSVVLGRDITSVKAAEQELARVYQEYRDLVANSPDGIARLDVEGRYLFANERMAEFGGCKVEDFAGKPSGFIMGRPGFWGNLVRQVAASRKVASTEVLTPFGKVLNARLAPELNPSGEVTSILMIATDVTEQRQKEAALAELNQQYRDLVDHGPDGIARVDTEGRYVFVNQRWADMDGLRVDDYTGKHLGALTGKHDAFWHAVREVIETRQIKTLEFPPPGDTSPTAAIARFIPELSPNGEVRSVLLIATDITELKRSEVLAHERESMIAALFEGAAQAILAVDAQGVIRLANRMAETQFGYIPGGMIGLDHNRLIPDGLREKHLAHAAGFIAAPKQRMMGVGLDLTGRKEDGSLFPVEVSLSHVNTSRGLLAVAMVSDISMRKQQEHKLLESAEQIRRLGESLLTAQEDAARGIARELHDDITQRLAFLSIEIGKAAGDAANKALSPTLRDYQAQIVEICDSLRKISHQMHPSILDDLGFCASIQSLCRQLRRGCKAEVHFEAHGVPDQVDRTIATCLYRVCQECLRNIEKHAATDTVRVAISAEEGWLQLTVTDWGIGFDPGSAQLGLGTRSMHERVRFVGGTVAIESIPGEGTRVVVRAPLNKPSLEL